MIPKAMLHVTRHALLGLLVGLPCLWLGVGHAFAASPGDTVPPSGTVVINSGAGVTNSRMVTLTLSATDNSGTVTHMRFSNTGTSYSSAQAYATTKTWTLSSGNGVKTVYAQFRDAAGNWSAAAQDKIVLDTTRPTVSSVAASDIAPTSARITWTTNEPATSQVEYGLTTSYGQSTVLDQTQVTAHSVTLTNLQPSTLYNFRVRSRDAAGNERVGSNATFTTPAVADTTPPTTPTNLTATAIAPSQINLSWIASTDNEGVAGYRIYRGQGSACTPSAQVAVWTGTATAYSDTGLLPSTPYCYSVTAYDAALNVSSQSNIASATTQSPDTVTPVVSIASPLDGQIVSSIVTVSVDASDNIGVVGVQLMLDGANLGPEDTVPPFSFTWNTAQTTNGSHTLAATARDAAGNQTTSIPVAVTVSNPIGTGPLLKIDPTGRYLTDQNNQPFRVNGDAAWSLIAQVSKADAEYYVDNRQAKGFNLILTNLIEHYFSTNAPRNFYGDSPFTGTPFITPNEAYFAHADYVINAAGQRGIVVLLAPLYLGYGCGSQGWCAEVQAASLSDMRSWGRYVGSRYKNYNNIIWVIGSDADPNVYGVADKIREFVAGIREYDTRHLITAHNQPESYAVSAWPSESWLDLNSIYSYSTTLYQNSQTAYTYSPTKPYFMLESTYENQYSVTQQQLRAEVYWPSLSGGFGYVFGNCPIWGFGDSHTSSYCGSTNWKPQLDAQGSWSMKYAQELFNSRPWYLLVPDWSHTVMTAGYGSWGATSYATAARASDGSTIIAYLPTNRQVTIDMTKIAGSQAQAWWYNPGTGTSTTIGVYPTTGSQSFTPPSAGDWVLVMDATSIQPDNTPPSVPTNLVSTPFSSSQISLSWNASTDTGGSDLAGYRLYRCQGAGCTPSTQVATSTTDSYSDPGLTASTTYTYAVSAYDAAGNVSAQSASASATTQASFDTTSPAVSITAPTNGATVSSSITVTTNASDNVAVAGVQFKLDGADLGTEDTTSPYSIGWDTRTTTNGSHTLTAVARDTAGNTSTSPPVTVTVNNTAVGLMAAYPLNEGSGTTIADSSGNGNTGAISGVGWSASGKYGSALSFSGTAGNVSIPNSPSVNISSSYTVSAWINPTSLSSSQYKTILIKGSSSCGYWLQLTNANQISGGFELSSNCSSYTEHITTGVSLQTNTWYHIATVFDNAANTFKIYLNGNQILSQTENSAPVPNTGNLTFGQSGYAGGNYERWSGLIDEVRVYNRALTQSEIQPDMNTPIGW